MKIWVRYWLKGSAIGSERLGGLLDDMFDDSLAASKFIFFSEHFYYPFQYYTICLFPENTISPYPQPWFSSWPNPS